MREWYLSLSVLEYVYFYLAVVATLLLIVQIFMMAFSVDNDVDLDGDGDIDADTDSGVSIFTTKSLTAFFSVGSLAGLLTSQLFPDHPVVSVPVAIVSGLLAMFTVVFTIRGILKLQCNGNLDTEKLVGKTATVYVSIPQNREGRGKITLEAQGKFMELDAVTDEQRLDVDTQVVIKAMNDEVAEVAIVK